MNSFSKKVMFHLKRILFEKFAIPVVRNENISKIIFKKYLPQKPIIIDCGAHDGADTVSLAKIYKGPIHAFEPVDKIFDRLKTRTKDYHNITCYQIALSNQNGVQDFYVSEGTSDGSSSLLKPKDHLIDHPDTYFNTKLSVNTLTLDAWAELNKIDHIDLLWLDMQGFELNMLKASTKILPTVKVIHTEVSTKDTYETVAKYDEYKAYLEKIGFKLLVEAIPKGWDMGNALFVRK